MSNLEVSKSIYQMIENIKDCVYKDLLEISNKGLVKMTKEEAANLSVILKSSIERGYQQAIGSVERQIGKLRG